MRLPSRVLPVVLTVVLPLSAFADEPREHDGGFFLRLSPGFGALNSEAAAEGNTVKLSGSAGAFDLALGYGVSPNLIVHGNIGAWSALDPTLEFNSTEFPTGDLTVSLTSFGAGVTYYVGDSNVFLTGSVGLAQLTAEVEGDESDTGTGFAVEAAVGKEWWVSDRWGLGVGGVVGYHSVPEEDIDGNWSGTSFGLRLTATMN